MDTKTSGIKKLFLFPARIIAISFAAVILSGTLLLMLPLSSRAGEVTPFLDCLFTATSATCVTGLIIYDTYSHWTPFGQGVILTLIQIGGLGLVTFTTFFNLMIGKKLGLRGMHLAQESVASFGGDIRGLIRIVILTALTVESAGALLLMPTFVGQYGLEGVPISIFLAVSAFCNAGFDVLGRQTPFISLCNYNGNPVVLATIATLIVIGGIGFIVIYDLLLWRKTRQLTLHTRIVLAVTGVLILAGGLMTAISEWNNPETLASLPTTAQKIGASFFHSVSSRTAGFNSISMEGLNDITKVLTSVLMFFGAAPGSTGGGIKVTTMAVIFMTVFCIVRGDEDTVIFGRKVGQHAVYKSLAVTVLGALAVLATSFCIVATMREHNVSEVDALFESVSAFATVGLSAGVSAIAGTPAKLLLIFSMFIGRIGPVSLFLSLALRPSKSHRRVMPEGKIQIG